LLPPHPETLLDKHADANPADGSEAEVAEVVIMRELTGTFTVSPGETELTEAESIVNLRDLSFGTVSGTVVVEKEIAAAAP
jgi:hypothetical protein